MNWLLAASVAISAAWVAIATWGVRKRSCTEAKKPGSSASRPNAKIERGEASMSPLR